MDSLYHSLTRKLNGQTAQGRAQPQTHPQQAIQHATLPDWTEQCGRPCVRLQSTIAHILNERAPDTYEVDYVPVFNPSSAPATANQFTEIELRIRLKGVPFFPDTNKTAVDCCIMQELQNHFGEGNFQRLVSQWGLQKIDSPTYCIRLNVSALGKLEKEIDTLQQKIGEESSIDRKARMDTRMLCEFDKPSTHQFNPQHPTLVNLTTAAIPNWMTPYAQPVENLMKFCCDILPQGRYTILFEPHYGDFNPTTGKHNGQLVAIALRIMMNGQNVALPSGDVTAIRFDIVQELRDQLGWGNCRELLLDYGLSRDKKSYLAVFSLDGLDKFNDAIAGLQQQIAEEVPDQRTQRLQAKRESAVQAQSYVNIALNQFDQNAQLQQHENKEFLKELRIMTEIMTTFQYAFAHDEGFKAAITQAIPKFNWARGIVDAEQRYEIYIIYIESTPRYQILLKRIFHQNKAENVEKFMTYSDYCNDLIDYATTNNDEYFSALRNILGCAFMYVENLEKK